MAESFCLSLTGRYNFGLKFFFGFVLLFSLIR